MKFLTNKHFIIAMLIAPILAVIAWFAADYTVKERPHAARSGGYYPLSARSNCRYQSGACTLKNEDVELLVRANRIDDARVELSVESQSPVDTLFATFSNGDTEAPPVELFKDSGAGDLWKSTLTVDNPETSTFRLVAQVDKAFFFVETSALFVDYQTSFSRENFPE